jgi:hypothetical protein
MLCLRVQCAISRNASDSKQRSFKRRRWEWSAVSLEESLTTSIDRTISRDEGLVASGFSEHPLLTSSSRFRALPKPFRPDDLLRAVREQLDAS